MTTQTLSDGSVVVYSADGTLLKETTPDGSVYTGFDADGKAHHVQIPPAHGQPATSADISYQGADTVYTYADGTVVTYDAGNQIISERLADGTDYTQFDGTGKAHHINIPAQNDQPATSADISYQGADTVYTYTDNTVVTYDAANHITDEKLADGTDYTQFDSDKRPHEVTVPATGSTPATSAQIAYDNAYTTYTYADKTVLTYQSSNNALLSEKLPNGSLYTQFDASKQPHHVDVPAYNGKPATSADITYADGHTVYTYKDGSIVTYDTASEQVLTQKTPDGLVFSDFDANDLPRHVEVPATAKAPATSADITYPDGHTVYTYKDGSIVTYDTASNTILTEAMPDGQVYSQFDTDGNAHHVEIPATAKAPATSAEITYADGHSIYTYTDGSTVTYDTATSTILTETMPDGTVYTKFDSDGNAHHVEIPATAEAPAASADITYGNGTTIYTYADKTVVTYDTATNTILTETMPDGTVYTKFDTDNNPHHVDIPAQNGKPATSADITYANGQSIYTYPDGTKVTFDSANQVVKQEMPDGWVINYADGKPSGGSNAKTGATVTITPDGDGTVWAYSDGTTVWEDSSGSPWKETANGWTFTQFNGDGQPTYGTMTASDGSTETVTINYDFDGLGDTQWIYTDNGKTTTLVTDPNGAPLTETGPDGKTFAFAVEIPNLLTAIHQVSTQRDVINSAITSVGKQFEAIHDDLWTGPGSNAFYSHIVDFQNLQQQVAYVLSEAIQRMEISYNNYVAAEQASETSLTPIPVETSPGFDASTKVQSINLGYGSGARTPPS